MIKIINKIKKILHSLDPTYEMIKELEKLNIQIHEYNINLRHGKHISEEYERLNNMSDEEKIEEKEKKLNFTANILLNKLESDSELYRFFNNILRKKKFKNIEDNINE